MGLGDDECPVTCAITLCVPDDPVSTPCGHTFSKKALDDWKKRSGEKASQCPECRAELPKGDFQINVALRSIIQSWRKERTANKQAVADAATSRVTRENVEDVEAAPVSPGETEAEAACNAAAVQAAAAAYQEAAAAEAVKPEHDPISIAVDVATEWCLDVISDEWMERLCYIYEEGELPGARVVAAEVWGSQSAADAAEAASEEEGDEAAEGDGTVMSKAQRKRAKQKEKKAKASAASSSSDAPASHGEAAASSSTYPNSKPAAATAPSAKRAADSPGAKTLSNDRSNLFLGQRTTDFDVG